MTQAKENAVTLTGEELGKIIQEGRIERLLSEIKLPRLISKEIRVWKNEHLKPQTDAHIEEMKALNDHYYKKDKRGNPILSEDKTRFLIVDGKDAKFFEKFKAIQAAKYTITCKDFEINELDEELKNIVSGADFDVLSLFFKVV